MDSTLRSCFLQVISITYVWGLCLPRSYISCRYSLTADLLCLAWCQNLSLRTWSRASCSDSSRGRPSAPGYDPFTVWLRFGAWFSLFFCIFFRPYSHWDSVNLLLLSCTSQAMTCICGRIHLVFVVINATLQPFSALLALSWVEIEGSLEPGQATRECSRKCGWGSSRVW